MKTKKNLKIEKIYNKHVSVTSIKNYSIDDALTVCAELIDSSFHLGKIDGITKSTEFLLEISKRNLNLKQESILYYFLGNAYSDVETLLIRKNIKSRHDFKNQDREKATFYFRKALSKNPDNEIKIQSIINLANQYDFFGRFVYSIGLYNLALTINKDHPMVLGNKGIALWAYAGAIHDKNQKPYFIYFSFKALKKALKLFKNNTEAKKYFIKKYHHILKFKTHRVKEADLKLNDYFLGATKKEIEYKKWCLPNILYLNPLNDLGSYSIAAQDILHLPPMILDIDQNHIEFPSFYNQLKQEYASARFLLYEGLHNLGKPHVSDKDVFLINPLDYPRYSIHIEKIKASFKMAYSIFDKISLFLRNYLKLEDLKEYQADFRKIWYLNIRKEKFSPKIIYRENWALRGLYIISKDLLFHHPNRQKDEIYKKELKESLDPSAKEINELRNNMEHGYVKVHEDYYDFSKEQIFKDKLCFSISESDLIKYSLKLIKLAREAIIYLSVAVYIEERKKEEKSNQKILPRIVSDEYEDHWKV